MQLIEVEAIEPHLDLLYQLLKERPEKACISHNVMPSYSEHVRFVQSNPYRKWFIIDSDGYAGAVYVTHNDEIGVGILKDFQRMGLGLESIDMIMTEVIPNSGHFLANINPCNGASIRLFEGLGFSHIQNTYRL